MTTDITLDMLVYRNIRKRLALDALIRVSETRLGRDAGDLVTIGDRELDENQIDADFSDFFDGGLSEAHELDWAMNEWYYRNP